MAKKIMFSDKYGLTQAVLEGRKTMTRRIIKGKWFWERCPEGMWSSDEIKAWEIECEQRLIDLSQTEEWSKAKEWALSHITNYKVGDIVAVAQSYNDVYEELKRTHGSSSSITRDFFHKYIQGGRMPVSNKMFVKPEAMLHQIRITDIKVERLQDISDDDCIKEGVIEGKFRDFPNDMFYPYKDCKDTEVSWTAKCAFSKLIDKVSGKGTWESNPWVFAYTFELVK